MIKFFRTSVNLRYDHFGRKNVLLLTLLVNSFSFLIYGQRNEKKEQAAYEILQNETYLRSNLVLLYGDKMPFIENGKLGIKNLKSEILLPAIYDSIYQSGNYFLITKKGTTFQLLNDALQNCFDSTVQTISYFNGFFTAIDKNNEVSRYEVMQNGKQLRSMDAKNHLISNAYIKQTPVMEQGTYIRSYVLEHSFCDSVQFIRGKEFSEIKLYKSGSVHWSKSGKISEHEIHFEDIVSLSIQTDDSRVLEVYNFRTKALLFTVEASGIEAFSHLGKRYLIATNCSGDKNTKIYSSEGELILEIEHSLQFIQGLLYRKEERTYPQPDNYTLFSFPEYNEIRTGITHLNTDYPFVIASKKDENQEIYYQGKLIYTLPYNKNTSIADYGVFPETSAGVVSIEVRTDRGKRKEFLLISTKGKLLGKSKRSIHCGYSDNFNQVIIRFSVKGVGDPAKVGFYNADSDELLMYPVEDQNWQQVDSNIILNYDNEYNKKTGELLVRIYFTDLKGNKLNNEVFSDERIIREYNEIKLLELEQNNTTSIYTSKLEKLCDSCCFNRSNSNSQLSYYIINFNPEKEFVQLADDSMKKFSEESLAIIFCGNYYAVLTKERQIRYYSFDSLKK